MIPGRLYADDGHPEDEAYNEFARCTFTARSNYGVNSKIKALVDKKDIKWTNNSVGNGSIESSWK